MNRPKPVVATLGSHSALQIAKGAGDEGLANLVIARAGRDGLYQRYSVVNEVRTVRDWDGVTALAPELALRGAVMVPHGSFVAYLGPDANLTMPIDFFGPRRVLRWEANRILQRDWLHDAQIPQPEEFATPDQVDVWPVIIKGFGAAGGAGYELCPNRQSLDDAVTRLEGRPYTIQQYIVGVTLYIHYFQSVMRDRLEILGMDRRYETNVDGIGRLPHNVQAELSPQVSYVVVGNSPLVLRESMLEEAYLMGERVIQSARRLIDPRGLWGPFCLETVITPDMRFHVIEISTRIVAGSNMFVDGSPYAALLFDEPMSTGRRIARELREAHDAGRLADVLDGPVQ